MRYYASIVSTVLGFACTVLGAYLNLVSTKFIFIPRAWAAGAVIFLLFSVFLNTLPQEESGVLRDVFKNLKVRREREQVGV